MHNSMVKCLIHSSFEFTCLWREKSCITINGSFHYPTAETDVGQHVDIFGSTTNSGAPLINSPTCSLAYLLALRLGQGNSFTIVSDEHHNKCLVVSSSVGNVIHASLTSDDVAMTQEIHGPVTLQVYCLDAFGTTLAHFLIH